MRGECKYAHDGIRYECVCGEWKEVKVTECWGEKEPSICDARRREYCDRYKQLYETKLKWQHRRNTDGSYYGVCARCGWHYELVEANYCPNCGYEYKPWDGKIL
jgi:hypothetical protein|nr:MAG TPA: PROTEIN/RNA Complex, archaeal, ribosomal, 50S, protein.0A [Caudoviricetes sp.]